MPRDFPGIRVEALGAHFGPGSVRSMLEVGNYLLRGDFIRLQLGISLVGHLPNTVARASR
jgi:hypothetical protein